MWMFVVLGSRNSFIVVGALPFEPSLLFSVSLRCFPGVIRIVGPGMPRLPGEGYPRVVKLADGPTYLTASKFSVTS